MVLYKGPTYEQNAEASIVLPAFDYVWRIILGNSLPAIYGLNFVALPDFHTACHIHIFSSACL